MKDEIETTDETNTTLAQDLGLILPDGNNPTYANGDLQQAAAPVAEKPKRGKGRPKKEAADPGPGRRAIPITPAVDPLDVPLREGETVAFQIKDGEVIDVRRRPAAFDPYALIRERIALFAAEVTDIAHVEVTETITLTIRVGQGGEQ